MGCALYDTVSGEFVVRDLVTHQPPPPFFKSHISIEPVLALQAHAHQHQPRNAVKPPFVIRVIELRGTFSNSSLRRELNVSQRSAEIGVITESIDHGVPNDKSHDSVCTVEIGVGTDVFLVHHGDVAGRRSW